LSFEFSILSFELTAQERSGLSEWSSRARALAQEFPVPASQQRSSYSRRFVWFGARPAFSRARVRTPGSSAGISMQANWVILALIIEN
jgi:hypothetical protein